MKQLKYRLGLISAILILLSTSSATWGEHAPPQDNRLPSWGDSGNNTVDLTRVDILMTAGKVVRGSAEDSVFTAVSTSASVFTLNSAVEGYDNVVFNGVLVIDVEISPRGFLREGGFFAIYSTDAVFSTDNTTTYNCNNAGNNCSSGQLIYAGDLSAFGWAESTGLFEFEIVNLSGWAKNNWAPMADAAEHVLLNVDCTTQPTSGPGICFDMFATAKEKKFEAIADGFAVVPDAAAVAAVQ